MTRPRYENSLASIQVRQGPRYDYAASFPHDRPVISDLEYALIDSVPGWMNRGECERLAGIASCAKTWLEIGTHAGRSLLSAALHLAENGTAYAIDPSFDTEWLSVALSYLQQLRPDVSVVQYQCTSSQASKLSSVPRLVDVVFVDGDHEYNGCQHDISIWKHRCKFMCGHDCFAPGVVRAINEHYPDALRSIGLIWETFT